MSFLLWKALEAPNYNGTVDDAFPYGHPHPTVSVDEALRLLQGQLAGWTWTLQRGHCLLVRNDAETEVEAWGKPTALTICTALLRALEAGAPS